MSEARATTRPRSAWNPTKESFEKFLRWLDDGSESEGASYIEMRRRMVAYFVRKGCVGADDLADETLNRVNRRLDEEGEIITETPARYCYIVAKFVFLEHRRAQQNNVIDIDSIPPDRNGFISKPPDSEQEQDRKETMLSCLDKCTAELDDSSRDLIFGYYFGETSAKIASRRSIAAELGITVNALSIRACRIRGKLEKCVEGCSEKA